MKKHLSLNVYGQTIKNYNEETFKLECLWAKNQKSIK